MLNKKLLFALIIFIIAVSSVNASDFNSTDVGGIDDSTSHNADVQSGDDNRLSVTESDALERSQTVYFDASASKDGIGSKTSPYKYFYEGRILSGDTAYFADGVYEVDDEYFISDTFTNTQFIGQSRENTIIKSISSWDYNFIVNSNSGLIINDLSFENIHIRNYGNLTVSNANFKNSNGVNAYIGGSYFNSTCGGIINCNNNSYYLPSLNLDNCYFDSNSAVSGGVIAVRNALNVLITNCIFYNSTSNNFGGVIFAINSPLTIFESSFSKSSAKHGGVIYCEESSLTLINSNFTSSSAYSFGGVVASQLCNLISENCNFLDYYSLTDSGGAIYTERGSMDIYKSSFVDGFANFGGAICDLNASLTVSESVFQDNMANYGGSIFNMYNSVDIYDSRFINSDAIYGGAICSYLADSISLTDVGVVNANDMYIFAKTTTRIVTAGNTDLTNIYIVNTTLFDISSNVIAPIINYSPQSQSSIPSYYDSRDYGYITPVKDQKDGGNCWAFTAIATLEACLKKATGITYDFSEENIKNLMAIYSLVGRNKLPNDGGVDSMAFSYFTGWFGPIYDGVDEYDDYSALSTIYSPLFHVQNIYFLPTRTDSNDNDAIKKAIMDYGAVAASTYWDDSYHSITLVGWDDDYNDYDCFDNYAEGAWIVKNSWGEDSGEGGFVYLSYEQQFRAEESDSDYYHNYLYTFIFNDTEGYVRNYQYDINSVNYYVEGVGYENIFVADADEILSAFSTVFKEQTNYKVSLYKNGELILTQEGYSPSGYYTIPFKTKTPLSEGDVFAISIENLDDGPMLVPLSDADFFNLGTFPDGVSYIDFGNGWRDAYSHYSTPKVACIKAFTTPLTLNEVTLSVDEFSEVYVDELLAIDFKFNDTQLSGGLLTVNINGKDYYAAVEKGNANLKISFNAEGNYSLSAQYKNNLYVSNVVNFNFTVIKPAGEISVYADDLTKYYGSSETFDVGITENNQPVSGVSVKITVNGDSYTNTTDGNGQASFNLDLGVGSYNVTSQYGGKSVKSKLNIKATIVASDISCSYENQYVGANFVDIYGSELSNRHVTFKIGDVVYNPTTDANGFAQAGVKLSVGNYIVTVINPVNNEEKTFKLIIKKANAGILVKSNVSGDNVTLTAVLTPATANGDVIFTVGANLVNFTRPVSDGKAILTLANLNDGIYKFYATYLGNINFSGVKSSTETFTIDNTILDNIVLSAPNLNKYYGGSETFNVKVTNNDQPLVGVKVKVYVNGDSYTNTTDGNGQASFNLDLGVGAHTVTSEYGDESAKSVVCVKSTVDVDDCYYSYENSYLRAIFLDSYGFKLSDRQVIFKIGSTQYRATTNGDGLALTNVKLNAGSYTVRVINPVNGEEKTYTLTVAKLDLALTLEKVELEGEEAVKASLSRTDATGTITFTLGGKDYPAGISEGNSYFIINGKGNYTVYAGYSGDINFNPVSQSISVIIGNPTKLSAKDISKVYGDSKQLIINLVDSKGVAVANSLVNIDIYSYNDGYIEFYELKTNSKGQIKLNCNFAADSYIAYIENDDDAIKAKVVVKKATPKLYVNKKTFKVKTKTKKYTITLKNNNYKVMKNKKVTLKVNGKTYTAKTNNYGKATFKITKLTKRGTFTATVKYAGNDYYKAISKKAKLYIK